MQVHEIPTESITVSGRFREDIGDLDPLIVSIKEKGLIQPITISKSLHLIAGERRLRAFKFLKLPTIPAIIRETTDELDHREIELMENIARKDMTWQEVAALTKRINELKSEQDPNWNIRKQAELLDVSKSLVARNISLAKALELMPELAEYETADAAVKRFNAIAKDLAMQELGKRSSDRTVYKFAHNHFKIGDAIEGMRSLAPSIIGFAEVDPPYAIKLDELKRGDTPDIKGYTEIAPEDYPTFIEKTAIEVFRVLEGNAWCIWWHGPTWHTEVKSILRNVGFKVSDIPGIWYRGAAGQTNAPRTNLANSYEPFFICRKGIPVLAKQGRSNVFHYQPVHPDKKIHPTEKPLELLLEIVDTFTFPNVKILSPFLGSGVTLIAAYKRGLIGFGWDLSEAARDKFLARIDFTFSANEQKEEDNVNKSI